MDTEEGVEVVWNEVLFSDKKVFKAQEVLRLPWLLCLFKGFKRGALKDDELICLWAFSGEDQGDV